MKRIKNKGNLEKGRVITSMDLESAKPFLKTVGSFSMDKLSSTKKNNFQVSGSKFPVPFKLKSSKLSLEKLNQRYDILVYYKC